jgi:hypothetical protein
MQTFKQLTAFTKKARLHILYLNQDANLLPVTIVPITDTSDPVDKILILPHTGQQAATHGVICDSMSRTTDSRGDVPQTRTEA